MLTPEQCKKNAAEASVKYIKSNTIVGLGTGSTVFYLIPKIANLIQKGFQIKALSTSKATEQQALKLDIPLTDFSSTTKIDLTIDGADEVDQNLNLIKGGGGALFREKMVALASLEVIIIVDERKIVKTLGKFPLPVEIVPYGWQMTQKHIEGLGCRAVIRKNQNQIFITDNKNYILDCFFDKIEKPEKLNKKLKLITGVVETGLFVEIANKIVVGKSDGLVEFILKKKASKKLRD